MAEWALALVKTIGGPGSLGLLVLCVVLGVVLAAWRSTRRIAGVVLAATFAGYACMALPVVAHRLADRLPDVAAATPDDLGPLDLLIVLDGDNRLGRAREAARVFRLGQRPGVWLLGPTDMEDALVEAGVPADAIRRDDASVNTREQLAQVADQQARAPGRAALVVSALHAPRVAAIGRSLGLTVPILAAPVDADPPAAGVARFVPNLAALTLTRDAIYEHVAIRYQAWRGWADR
jgi:uncharacterized SAM-binding protein YcdF (DUF218 family)